MIILRNNEAVAYQKEDFTFHYLSWAKDGIYNLDYWHEWLHLTEKGNHPIGPTVLCEWGK